MLFSGKSLTGGGARGNSQAEPGGGAGRSRPGRGNPTPIPHTPGGGVRDFSLSRVPARSGGTSARPLPGTVERARIERPSKTHIDVDVHQLAHAPTSQLPAVRRRTRIESDPGGRQRASSARMERLPGSPERASLTALLSQLTDVTPPSPSSLPRPSRLHPQTVAAEAPAEAPACVSPLSGPPLRSLPSLL